MIPYVLGGKESLGHFHSTLEIFVNDTWHTMSEFPIGQVSNDFRVVTDSVSTWVIDGVKAYEISCHPSKCSWHTLINRTNIDASYVVLRLKPSRKWPSFSKCSKYSLKRNVSRGVSLYMSIIEKEANACAIHCGCKGDICKGFSHQNGTCELLKQTNNGTNLTIKPNISVYWKS